MVLQRYGGALLDLTGSVNSSRLPFPSQFAHVFFVERPLRRNALPISSLFPSMPCEAEPEKYITRCS